MDRHTNGSIPDLIRTALSLDPDTDEYWDTVMALQQEDAPEIVSTADRLCASPNPRERALGVDILAQLKPSDAALEAAAKDIVLSVLTNDVDLDVLTLAAGAEGQLQDPRATERLIEMRRHPDEDVRFSVVHGLGWRREETAIAALVELTDDSDNDVRNWATFFVAQMEEVDSPEIREALLRRTDDEDAEVRGEALRGLALRDDERVIEPLIRELRAIAKTLENYWNLAFEAAMEMADLRLYPALAALTDACSGDVWFDYALAACRIPEPDEEEEADDAPTTCPVCGSKHVFSEPDGIGCCPRCGWHQDSDQRDNPDSTDGSNRRSLNQERERWKMRLEAGKQQSRDG